MTPRWRRAGAQSAHHHAAAHHADDWLMTYADMITLLLCFFAVFLSVAVAKVSAPRQEPAAQALLLPMAAQAVMPFPAPDPVDPPKEEAAPEPMVEAAVIEPGARVEPPVASAQPLSDPVAGAQPVGPGDVPGPTLAEMQPQAEPKVYDQPSLPPQPAPQDQKSDRITALEMSSAAFFDSGSATLSKQGATILKDVAVTLMAEKFRDYQATVEGHTDDSPISTARFPSNWELSTARAAAVVHFLLDQGVPAQKLRAAGYADTFPKAPNRDAAGNPIPANQLLNRRVVIRLEKIEKAGKS